MLKTTLALLVVLSSVNFAYADNDQSGGIAKIIVASASTTFEGKKLPEDATLGTLGTLKTGRDGGAKLKFIGNDVLLDIAANSVVKIVRPAAGEPNEVIELVSGMVRAQVGPLKESTKERAERPTFTLRSKTVTMGVRGTDFLGIANPVLDESEIVVFTGKVDFTSTKSSRDTKLVSAGYWGGIGGRFGAKTHDLIKLPAAALTHYKELSQDTAAYSLDKQPSGTPVKQSETGH